MTKNGLSYTCLFQNFVNVIVEFLLLEHLTCTFSDARQFDLSGNKSCRKFIGVNLKFLISCNVCLKPSNPFLRLGHDSSKEMFEVTFTQIYTCVLEELVDFLL